MYAVHPVKQARTGDLTMSGEMNFSCQSKRSITAANEKRAMRFFVFYLTTDH